MRAVVTGAAGFIGSVLAERLVTDGHDVVGVDCFTDAYAPALKRRNVRSLIGAPGFALHEIDLCSADLGAVVAGADVVFHLAAVPGVRASWSNGFADYAQHNIVATQRLLEAVRNHGRPRVVYASSSSVYGNADAYPVAESARPRPHSPYGVSKLAGELLCETYVANFGIEAVLLRYFSVYGPRQRPDMGVHRMIDAALRRTTFRVFGSGEQVRDMTYVDDVAEATVRAGTRDVVPGSVINVAGGVRVSVAELLERIADVAGADVPNERVEAQSGDVRRTAADTARAADVLGWEPVHDLDEGLRRQIAWHRETDPASVA